MNSLFLHLLVSSDVVNASNAVAEIFRYILYYIILYYIILADMLQCCRTTFTTLVSLQYVWLLAPTELKLGR